MTRSVINKLLADPAATKRAAMASAKLQTRMTREQLEASWNFAAELLGLEPAAVRTSMAAEGPGENCGCKPFTQVVKDPTLYEACRKRADKIGPVTTPRAIYDLVAPDIVHLTHEEFRVLGLGTRGDFEGKVMTYARVAHGDQHEVKVYIEQISQILLADRPDIYILIHSHPGGDATPSEEDEKLTDGIIEGLKKTCPRIVYGDHVIMATSEFYSFREKKKTKIR